MKHVIRHSYALYIVSEYVAKWCVERPGIFAKNLWDDRLVQPLKMDSATNKKVADAVPTTYEEVCEWAIIVSKPIVINWTHPFMVLYKCLSNPPSSTVYPITVHLQGFLGTHNLFLFGSWDG